MKVTRVVFVSGRGLILCVDGRNAAPGDTVTLEYGDEPGEFEVLEVERATGQSVVGLVVKALDARAEEIKAELHAKLKGKHESFPDGRPSGTLK